MSHVSRTGSIRFLLSASTKLIYKSSSLRALHALCQKLLYYIFRSPTTPFFPFVMHIAVKEGDPELRLDPNPQIDKTRKLKPRFKWGADGHDSLKL